jgi:hypothetical protein
LPKLVCPCGYVHDLSPIPDAGYVLVKDTDYEALIEAETTRIRLSEELRHDPRNQALLDEQTSCDRVVFQMIRRLYDCPQCGRLIRLESDEYRTYVPESDDEGG